MSAVRKWHALLSAAIAAFILASCFSDSSKSGGKSPTNPDNGKPPTNSDSSKPKGLHGKLVDSEGKAVSRAKVKSVPFAEALLKAGEVGRAFKADSAVTDSAGRYAFTDLPAGTYNIQGDYENGKLMVFIPATRYDGNGAVKEIVIDTLREPGGITGKVVTHTDDDGGVLAYIPGTSYLAITDDSGGFALSSIPQGRFTVAYRKEGLKTAKDSGVEVRSGKKTELPIKSMEADPAYPPPAPGNVAASYDTAGGIVTLRWKPVVVSDLDGYVIYRNESSSTDPQRISGALIQDTAYVDTVFRDPKDPKDLALTYRVKSQDKGANLSAVFSNAISIQAPSRIKVRTTFTFSFLDTKGDSASPGDTVSIIAAYANSTRKNTGISWYQDRKDSAIRSVAVSSKSGTDTLRRSWSKPGRYTLRISATDEAGSIWWDSLSVSIVRDAPAPRISGNPSAKVNETTAFSVQAAQAFGSLVMYKWDDGKAAGWDDSSASMSQASFTYAARGVYQVRAYVRDDDGNADSAVSALTVTNGDPVVSGLRDTTVSIKDTVTFAVSASDPEGIRRYLWDFDGDGVNEDTTTVSTLRRAFPGTPQVAKVVVTVQDNFDGSSKDTAMVTVIQDPPMAGAGKDTTVSVNDAISWRCSSSDRFGRIVIMERSIGGGAFIRAASHDTILTAPASENLVYRILFRVTDDDGNAVVDTAIVRVEQDPPAASITAKDSVRVDSLYAVSASGSKAGKFGNIVKYEWRIGSAGSFAAGPRDTVLQAPSAEQAAFEIALRVTDDDGNTAEATRNIRFHKKWIHLGTPGFSEGLAWHTSLAMKNDTPYVAYGGNGSNGVKATVMRYAGNAWTAAGASGFSQGEVSRTTLQINNGVPYVAYRDHANGNKATVMRFDGNAWVLVGAAGFSAAAINDPSLAFDNTTPYLAFGSNVMRFDGSSWSAVGSSGLGGEHISLAIDNGIPHVAFKDWNFDDKASVIRYTGGAWQNAGNRGFSSPEADIFSMAFLTGAPYVAYNDFSRNDKTSVMRLNGNTWVLVGNEGFTSSAGLSVSLAMDGGVPWIAIGGNGGNGSKAEVRRLEGNSWVPVGAVGFSQDRADFITLRFYNSMPYVAFSDAGNGGKATVMVYR